MRKHVTIEFEKDDEIKEIISFSSGIVAICISLICSVAVCPTPQDNCAISKTIIHNGSRLKTEEGEIITIKHTVLEGHR